MFYVIHTNVDLTPTNPPTHQPTNPPTHQPTNPPTHQPTNHDWAAQ
ncbi:PT domain-containing protein [Escherichia coli]|nr:PT domain-containing protein [Escherichia coli]EMA9103322.1 PT domain-containing protein [Escherichia coli]QMG87194.1 PT domain-containing protein [Escherichia coli]